MPSALSTLLLTDRMRLLGGALTFVVSLGTYLWTLAPTVTFVDSGELIVAARNLGVAHPPGMPLYVLLAHMATLVPVGNVAVRVNFASAAFAALAATTTALLLGEMLLAMGPGFEGERQPRQELRGKRKGRDASRTGPVGPGRAAANDEADGSGAVLGWVMAAAPLCVAGLLLAFSRTLWSFATVAEVYSLNTWLILVILFLVVRWRRRCQGGSLEGERAGRLAAADRLLYAAAFVFGLSLGVHHVTVVVALPALLFLVYRTKGGRFFASRQFVGTASLALAGVCLVYSYLPIVASRLPVLNWGDPRTLQRLWWHVTGKQYQVFMGLSVEQMAGQAAAFARLAVSEFGPFWLPAGLVLAALGFIACFRRDRTTFVVLSLLVVADLGYALNYDISEDKGAYYLPSFVAAAIAGGLGAQWVLSLSVARRAPSRVTSILALLGVLAGPVAALAGNAAICDRRQYFLATDYIGNIESTIAPDGMLLTGDWQVYSPLLYLHEVEGLRRDIVAIDVNMLRRSWYVEYLTRAYPSLIAQTRVQVEAFLEDLRAWEQDPAMFASNWSLTQRIDGRFREMILAFVHAHLRTSSVYATHDVVLAFNSPEPALARAIAGSYEVIPQGLVFEISADRSARSLATLKIEMRGLADGTLTFDPDDVVMLKVKPVYLNMLVNRGRYLAMHGRHDLAVQAFRQALDLDPTFAVAAQDLSRSTSAMRTQP